MSLGINLLMYLTEITSASLSNNYLSKVLKYIINIKRSSFRNSFNAWKGIAVGKSKDFYKLVGKKYLNKIFLTEKN